MSRILILLLLAIIGASGCGNMDGGAVEFAWGIRDTNGSSVGDSTSEACDLHEITAIRLCWEGTSNKTISSDNVPTCESDRIFSCKEARGKTNFIVSEGKTAFFIRALCLTEEEQEDPTMVTENTDKNSPLFQTPPPMVREVKAGEVISLNQFLITTSKNIKCEKWSVSLSRTINLLRNVPYFVQLKGNLWQRGQKFAQKSNYRSVSSSYLVFVQRIRPPVFEYQGNVHSLCLAQDMREKLWKQTD